METEATMSAPAIEAAREMGAKGGGYSEAERLAFEAWMQGHCWSLAATWRGNGYQSDSEDSGRYDPQAAVTRMLWAAWRDRAALSRQDLLSNKDPNLTQNQPLTSGSEQKS